MPKLPKLPQLDPGRATRGRRDEGVVFAVYAPIGTDESLSRYPNPDPNAPIARVGQQALVRALRQVAAQGVNVSALIDLFDDDSYLVEIPAWQPRAVNIVSAWKQDMSDRHALAGFLRRVNDRFPCQALVLAIEGHGGGFVPDIDPARITPESLSRWTQGGQSGQVRWVQSEGGGSFEPEGASPILPMTSPILPMTSPILPLTRLPMSTWALGEGLRSAIASGVPRPAVVHFNNCFNASAELLHTLMPHADYATGYANYNYFTAGEPYPAVFRRLRRAGSATREQLARWFAAENDALLRAKQNHPSVGATVALARMKQVATALDKLSGELTGALRSADRPTAINGIKTAAINAQHYDTEPGFELQAPDQFIDLGSFAVNLQAQFAPSHAISLAAAAVQAASAGLWQYGDWDRPYMDERVIYDFRKQHLGLNILLPDPALQGIWDWRSPYYLSGTVDPARPPAHRHVIAFLADRAGRQPPWVEFIIEYHSKVDFVGFLPARAPLFPLFNARFEPKLPHPGDDRPGEPQGPAGGAR